jgi:hypothetical protein
MLPTQVCTTAFSFTFGCDIIRHSERGIMRLLHTALAISIAFAGAFAADNPFIGTWKLIPEKSKFAPDPPPPKSLTMTFQPDGEKVRLIVTGVDSAGKPIKDDNSILWDGKFYTTNGGPMGPGRVAVKRVNNNQNEVMIEAGGKKVLTIKSVLSKDGKTMRNVADGVNPKGEKIHSDEVFEKQ